jgi:sodium-dependent dicarboxylate transporter 2/3/5
VALATSLGMALPISTPPNALAYATGNIETTEMSKAGIMTGIFGLIIIFTVVFILNQLNFF